MKSESTTTSARLLLAGLGLCGIVCSSHPAQADEAKPVAPEPAPLPRVFDGTAGFVRAIAYVTALEASVVGVVWAIRSNTNATHAADLAAPLSGTHGIDACRKPLAANVHACNDLASQLADRDKDGDYSVGAFVLGGVMATAATASIWLWRTPGSSYWLLDFFRVTPTAGPKSGGVILQGTW